MSFYSPHLKLNSRDQGLLLGWSSPFKEAASQGSGSGTFWQIWNPSPLPLTASLCPHLLPRLSMCDSLRSFVSPCRYGSACQPPARPAPTHDTGCGLELWPHLMPLSTVLHLQEISKNVLAPRSTVRSRKRGLVLLVDVNGSEL